VNSTDNIIPIGYKIQQSQAKIHLLDNFNKQKKVYYILKGGFMFDIKRILGGNIKILRKAHKLTQEQLSEKIECSVNHLASIEIGKKYPSPKLLSRIADVLNVTPAELFYTQGHKSIEEILEEVLKIVNFQNNQTQESIKKLLEKNRQVNSDI